MMQRGAYLARLDLSRPHLAGVRNKIKAQARALESTPANVDVYCLSAGDITCNDRTIASAGAGKFARRFSHYFLFYAVMGASRAPLDFVYMRHQGASPMLLWMLWRLRRRNPGLRVFLELPSWPYASPATFRDRLVSLIDSLSSRLLRSCVDRIVTFSREPEIFGIPTIGTDNGVDLDRIRVLAPKPASPSIRLLGLANLSYWHGYDRVIEGLARYRADGGAEDVHFDVVGTGVELARLKQLAGQHGLQGRVHFLGARSGDDLDAVMVNADVGISSLGMHRLRVDTSNLKSREFCARGLPFVIGYQDRDFQADFPYAFHAPADDSPLDIAAVLRFVDALARSKASPRREMRAFAERRLGWEVKMQPLVDMLRSADGT